MNSGEGFPIDVGGQQHQNPPSQGADVYGRVRQLRRDPDSTYGTPSW